MTAGDVTLVKGVVVPGPYSVVSWSRETLGGRRSGRDPWKLRVETSVHESGTRGPRIHREQSD